MTNEEEKVIEWLKNTSLDEMVQKIFCYISRLEEENKELKRKTYKAHVNDKGEVQFVFDNYISKDKIKVIVEKSYNDIDYFNRDIRKDLEDLLK